MEDISPEVRKFLSAFRARPGMYTGHDGMITELNLFLCGMGAFPLIYGDAAKADIIPRELHDFTAKYYGERSSVMGWRNIILKHEVDERSAFAKFWDILDECLISGGYEPLEKIEPSPTKYERRDTIDHILYCDLAALADSFCRVYGRDRNVILLRFRDLYRTPGFYGLAVWRNNFPVGAVVGNIEQTDEGEVYRISDFWVVPDERKRGYAWQLLNELRSILTFRGVNGFYSAVTEEQAKILGEYLGFTENGTLKIMELR